MSFNTPKALILEFFVLVIFIWWFSRGFSRVGSLAYSVVSALNGLSHGFRARVAEVPSLMKFGAVALVILALGRPQTSDSKVNRNSEGIDIMVTLDISDSMEIEDMKPKNRIGAAKAVIQSFILGRTSDRIGLIVFSGESYTRVPLTLDYSILTSSLTEVTSSDNIKQGTAIGVALANAVARLKDSTAKSRVIILLTDGENNSGIIHPDEGLEIAKGFGIKVYTIAVGSTGQTRLPIMNTDAFGNKIKTYVPFYSQVNEVLLKKIADDTGGQFFSAADSDALKSVFGEIDRMEKSKVEVFKYTRYTEIFPIILMWAFTLYALQLLLSATLLRRAP